MGESFPRNSRGFKVEFGCASLPPSYSNQFAFEEGRRAAGQVESAARASSASPAVRAPRRAGTG
eukprot:4739361-Prymnesium_polylepis.1